MATSGGGGRDIARLVRDQHEEIRRLCTEVPSSQGDERRAAFSALVVLLDEHEAVEARTVHPVVRTADVLGARIVEDRARESGRARRLLSAVERVGVDSDEFPPRFAVLRDAVLRHAEHEERTVLPLLERAPGVDDLDCLAVAVGRARPSPDL
jgi:hypothetical protein